MRVHSLSHTRAIEHQQQVCSVRSASLSPSSSSQSLTPDLALFSFLLSLCFSQDAFYAAFLAPAHLFIINCLRSTIESGTIEALSNPALTTLSTYNF